MTCDDVRPIVQIYLDNEVGALDARRVEEHLRDCDACRAEVEYFHRQDALLREAIAADPAPDADMLRQRIRRHIAAQRRVAAGTWALAAAAVVVLAFGSLAVWKRTSVDPVYARAVGEHVRAIGLSATGGEMTPPDRIQALVESFTGGRDVAVDASRMHFVSGHPCALGELHLAHLFYTGPDGRPVSLYLCQSNGPMPRGNERIDAPGGPVEVASVNGRTVAVSDLDGVRRIVVGDGLSKADAVAALGAVR